jgi:hypothetical protein
MRKELEDLADECRNWSVATPSWVDRFHHRHAVATRNQFKRLADKLDEIAKRLAEKLPTEIK